LIRADGDAIGVTLVCCKANPWEISSGLNHRYERRAA